VVLDGEGRVTRQEEDRNFDGKPDVISEFSGGVLRLVREDSKGRGCFDVEQRLAADGKTVEEQAIDENGDCKLDLWSHFANGAPVWQAQDQRGAGFATVLTRFDASGAPTTQELVGEGKRQPDTKIFLGAGGAVEAQCLDSDGNRSLDVRYRVSGGAVVEGLVDTTNDGKADIRQAWSGGAIAHAEIDTNADGRADVVQYFSGANVVRQCEDAQYDGSVDQCFEGQKVVPVSGVTNLAAKLPALGCGSFDAFWRR
jgi:hypothetical protein